MQKFLKGLDQSLSFIEKDRKDRAKKAAEKKAAKEAKYAPHSSSAETGTRKVYRKKSKTENDEHLYTPQLKKTGKVHVVSKRPQTYKTGGCTVINSYVVHPISNLLLFHIFKTINFDCKGTNYITFCRYRKEFLIIRM